MSGNEYPCSHGDPCECGYEAQNARAIEEFLEKNPHYKLCHWCGYHFDPTNTSDAWETCSLKCNMEWMAAEADNHFNGDKDDLELEAKCEAWLKDHPHRGTYKDGVYSCKTCGEVIHFHNPNNHGECFSCREDIPF